MKLAEALGISGRFVVGYIGTHGLAHSLETMVEAARAAEGKEDFLTSISSRWAAEPVLKPEKTGQ